MSDLPQSVQINEEGPREGFQFEKGPIATARKVELIDALSQTGLNHIQTVSFVNPRRVPGMADAEEVAARFARKPGVAYTGLWLNEKGLERAIACGRLDLTGSISLTASEPFLQRNQNRSLADNIAMQHNMMRIYKAHGVPVERGSLMAAFGCNFAGDIADRDACSTWSQQIVDIAEEHDIDPQGASRSPTRWPGRRRSRSSEVVGAVRERFPLLDIALHLHDTRGMGIANAYAGLEMGVGIFDSAVAGLGGCPFAAHKGAAGNVCTEDLVFMCEEMGIDTGVDLDALIEAARLAEDIVGHPLPGSVKMGGSLDALRRRAEAH